jgi:hypothetical protein
MKSIKEVLKKKDSQTPKAVFLVTTAFNYLSFEVINRIFPGNHKRFPQYFADRFWFFRLSREIFRILRGSC